MVVIGEREDGFYPRDRDEGAGRASDWEDIRLGGHQTGRASDWEDIRLGGHQTGRASD